MTENHKGLMVQIDRWPIVAVNCVPKCPTGFGGRALPTGVVGGFSARSIKIAFLVLLASLAPLSWSADKGAAGPFTLTIVPSRSSPQGRSITIADDEPAEFYVVLTNTSRETQPVFEQWNSWGYQTVSFEFTTPDGKKTVVSKRPQVFTVNYPSTFLIPPGEHQVHAIRLDKYWETRPTLSVDAGTQVVLKAIYQVRVTPEATKHKVWTGRAESKPYNLTLRAGRTPK